MKFSFAFPAAIAALVMGASFASADDSNKGADTPLAKVVASPRILVFGDGAARFQVDRDASTGRMTFRSADPALKIDGAPVVMTTPACGSKEFTLTALEGQPGVWVWSDDAVKANRFDGTMRVVVAGKTYTSPLATVWTTGVAADGWVQDPTVFKVRYGGRLLALPECGASVEVVQDVATGTLTIYSFSDVAVIDAPVITVAGPKGPTTVTLMRVEGKDGVWSAKHETFRTPTTAARIRLLVNGKPCEAPMLYSSRGGRMVAVTGGPSFEVVRDPEAGAYTFYAVDETFNGKAYTVESPTVVVNSRTYDLTRVEGEPRAWHLIGLDTAGSDSRDGQLNFTLLGKTLSTRVGFSGLGIGVK